MNCLDICINVDSPLIIVVIQLPKTETQNNKKKLKKT